MAKREKVEYPLVLASGSPRRLGLLDQIGVEPFKLMPANVDESAQPKETPRALAKRLSRTKAEVAKRNAERDPDTSNAYILAADTVVAVGRRILPKPELTDEAANCLRLLSGRAHRVYTSLCLINPRGKVRQKMVETRVRFKRLTHVEMETYLATGEWQGKAGGYAIQGRAGAFVTKIVGSYTNVVGLPLNETMMLLIGEGYPVYRNWTEPA